MTLPAVAYSYVRFSSSKQAEGDSLRRQTEGATSWCQRNGVQLDLSRTWHDLGKSAFLGEHRSNPDRHALAAFLKLVETGRIPSGSFLILEALDRLTREHVRAGLMLCLGLLEKGIKLVQLSPSEKVYDSTADDRDLMFMIMELARGHGESKRKSDLSGAAWRNKKASAKSGGIVSPKLPAWVRIENGKLVLIPEHAKTVRLIFKLAANGYGTPRIAAKLTADKVPPLGWSGKWVKGYLGKILRDRRALGEYQPRKGKRREVDGEIVKDYFPAVITEAQFYAARAGAAERGKLRGRLGTTQVNLFAGLLWNTREGDSYFMTGRVQSGKRYEVLINRNAAEGLSRCWSFPYLIFERAVLSMLKEIDAKEIAGGNGEQDEVSELAGQLVAVEGRIAELEAELASGDIPSLARALRSLEEQKTTLDGHLVSAKRKASRPVSEAWGEARGLIGLLDRAKDPADIRLKLRSVLRRTIESIWLLVTSRGSERLATVQIFFIGGKRFRVYQIIHKPPRMPHGKRRPGYWWCRSMRFQQSERILDLRKPSGMAKLLAGLEGTWPETYADDSDEFIRQEEIP